MEVIGYVGICLGILVNDGVLFVVERCNIYKFFDEVFFFEKIYKFNEDMVCSVVGIIFDVNVLINELWFIV